MNGRTFFSKRRQRWHAEMRSQGKRIHLGSYQSKPEADAALAVSMRDAESARAMLRTGGDDMSEDELLRAEPIRLHLHGGGELVIDRVSKIIPAHARLCANTPVEATIPDYGERRSAFAGKRMIVMSLPRVRFLEKPDPLAVEAPAG